MMNGFICPVCGGTLFQEEKLYRCEKNHCFDISAKGYVNLLTSNHMNAKLPGDNKLMVNARRDFLGKGYYSHLAEAMEKAASEDFTGGTVIDAGCGEGYYTRRIYDALTATGKEFELYGFDISKFACAAAARNFKGNGNAAVAAASIFRTPFADESADMLITMFAPFCGEEFIRVLKKGGRFIMAIPDEDHLYELKQAIYDEPYKNDVRDYEISGFEFVKDMRVSRRIHMDNNADILSLFSMTPYYYKTSEEGHRRASELNELDTEAAFRVLVYKKK